MNCPKCKKQLDEKTIKCPHCNTKIGSLCKFCGAYNPITATSCSNCHAELLKRCKECKSLNLPEATSCRKCGYKFAQNLNNDEELNLYIEENEPIIQSAYKAISQQKAKNSLVQAIKDDSVKIISISGESGIGKNLILRFAANELKSYKFIWLLGKCTQTTQLTPMGFIQDVLLTFFNINNYCSDTLLLKRNAMKFFKQDFPALTSDEINDLLNFMYPEKNDYYENIYFNKAKHINILLKVFKTILSQIKVLFVIDNFENMDGMSYEFLQELNKLEEAKNNCKFIFTYTEPTPVRGIFSRPEYRDNAYIDITIAPLKKVQIDAFLLQYKELEFNVAMKETLFKISKGNPSIIEQALNLLLDYKRLGLDPKLLSNIDLIISKRLEILRKEDNIAYKVLIAAAILGVKFYPALLENLCSIGTDYLKIVLSKLTKLNFISPVSNMSFEFKSNKIWSLILANAKQTNEYDQVSQDLFNIMSHNKLSTMATLGFLAQNLNLQREAFAIWTLIMKQASYIGDVNIYVIAQKQSLQLVDNLKLNNTKTIKKNIYSRLGKLLIKASPETSMEYLPKAIDLVEDSNTYQKIELLGYLTSCAMRVGNYYGAAECADAVLNILPMENDLERALVKIRKVRALNKIGNCGQVINLIDNEIAPVLNKYLNKKVPSKNITQECVSENWITISFELAEALIWSGNNRGLEIIKYIFETLEKNNIQNQNLHFKAQLLLALANSLKGNCVSSEEILSVILERHELNSLDENLMSMWNLVNLINRLLEHRFDGITEELFEAVTYANNIGDNFTKNILKTFLAKVLKENNENKKALEILEEQVSYFAKEKIATGVLLTWYLIAGTKLITKGSQFALDVANKALDVASGLNVNNYYFIVLFNKLIGEIYLSKGDFDSAKIYIEKGIIIAKQFEMEELIAKLYLLYGKYYEELALPKTQARAEHISNAIKMFQLAKEKAETLENPYLQKSIKEAFSVIISFCKLNGITLKKGN